MYRSLWCCSRYRSSALGFITSGAPAIRQSSAAACRSVADDVRQAIPIALLLPDHEKFADTIRLVLADRCFSQVAECVLADFDCPVVLQRKYLQPGYHHLTPHLVTNIALDRHDKAVLAQAQSGLLVIKLEGFVDHVGEGRQITGVVGPENPLIERFHLGIDGTIGIEAVGNGLRIAAKGESNQHQYNAHKHDLQPCR